MSGARAINRRNVMGLRRSVRLLQAFRHEATDPENFGTVMAEDTVQLVSDYCSLEGSTVVDVGGGSGYVAEAFGNVGARSFTVEYDPVEMNLGRHAFTGGVRGDGRMLPIGSGKIDLCFSSNVIEHVDGPTLMLAEMIRVVRPGGLVYVAFTNWLSPWGGHETSPWHYLGGDFAARRYTRKYGKAPKNYFGRNLFPLSIGSVLDWAKSNGEVEVIAAFPRYYPRWTIGLIRLPGVREVLAWNLALVMRKREVSPSVNSACSGPPEVGS